MKRIEEAHMNTTSFEAGYLLERRLSQSKHHVGCFQTAEPISAYDGTGLLIRLIGVITGQAQSTLHSERHAPFNELRHGVGNYRHPLFARVYFSRHKNLHNGPLERHMTTGLYST
jgi:hypothetical protein